MLHLNIKHFTNKRSKICSRQFTLRRYWIWMGNYQGNYTCICKPTSHTSIFKIPYFSIIHIYYTYTTCTSLGTVSFDPCFTLLSFQNLISENIFFNRDVFVKYPKPIFFSYMAYLLARTQKVDHVLWNHQDHNHVSMYRSHISQTYM